MESSIMEEEKMEEENTENQNYPITIQTEEPIQSSIKDKISNVLHHNNFCGICLELSDELLPLTSQLQFPEQEYSMTVGDLLRQVFGNACPGILFRGSVCPKCTKQIVQVLHFLDTTKRNARLYTERLLQLDQKIEAMDSQLSYSLKAETSKISSGLVILEDSSHRSSSKHDHLKRCKIWFFTEHKCPLCLQNNCKHKSPENNHKKLIRKGGKFKKIANPKLIICPICNKTFYKSCFRDHMVAHGKTPRLFCKICCLLFNTKKERDSHEKSSEHINKCRHRCKECSFATMSYNQLEAHVNREHREAAPYECRLCKKPFVTRLNLLKHVKTHEEKKRFSCPYCKTILGSKEGLKRHIYSFHEQDKLLPCTMCDKGFPCQYKRLMHWKTVHSKAEISPCPYCKVVMSNIHYLKRHIRTVHRKQLLSKKWCLSRKDIDFLRDGRRGAVEEMISLERESSGHTLPLLQVE